MKRPSTTSAAVDESSTAVRQSSRSGREKGDCRGLIIKSNHIAKFLEPVISRKTHEVRNMNCRVVKVGSSIYLLESGIKDSNNKGIFRIVAKAEFRGNSFVAHGDFRKHFAKHRCSIDEYNKVRTGWAQDKGGCVLWELIITDVVKPPLYLRPRQGEDCALGT